MNQNSQIILNMNNTEEKTYNSKAPRKSYDRYPFSTGKQNFQNQPTTLLQKKSSKEYLQGTKNMKSISKETFYPDKNFIPKTNKIEISANIKILKEDSEPLIYQYKNNIHDAHNNKFQNYNPHRVFQNEKINPLGSNPFSLGNDSNQSTNKTEISIPRNTKKEITNFSNTNKNNQMFYSPPTYNKRKEINYRNFDNMNMSEDHYNVEINESSLKPNIININVTQNKLILPKKDLEYEFSTKPQIISQPNSPYFLTENSKKNEEDEAIKSNDYKAIIKQKKEIAKDSRNSIQSFKEFSESFMQKTKNLFKFEKNENLRTKCKCDVSLNDNNSTCSRALKWIQYNYKLADLGNLKRDYAEMQKALSDEKCVDQIQKDLPRTFPSYKYFEKESEGYFCLQRILVTFSKYDPQLGYVQGMNFIAGNLLYHAEEYLAFWLFVMLFELLELRDVYLPKLPGLSKHSQILEILILKNMPDFYGKMAENSITVNMFFSPWIFSLFGVLIPVEIMADFLDNLLKGKWPFAYKFIFVFLQVLKPKLMEEDTIGMLTFLTENNYKNANQQQAKLNWKNCIKDANKIALENGFINKMLDNFDHDQQRFCIK